ncbi:MAG: PQQ-dependent sugar dehydrogenase [Chloroflexi bacterium]|nr:PQQ-dependent sugar dehydrogenase [Chloroflexota bacterium]
MNFVRNLCMLALAGVLTACGTTAAVPTATLSPTATPSNTPSALQPTSNPTATPAPSATTAPNSTNTPARTPAPSPLPTSAPTRVAAASGFNPAATTIRLEKSVSGLRQPTDLTSARDGSGRLFVVEKRGSIRIVRGGTLLPEPFLDISNIVRSSESERGLLGLAFHPQYARNGQFFVYYTDSSGDIVIARYTATGDRADAASGAEILRIRHRDASNHNGGGLAFGPDSYLYIGTGDGGGAGDRFGNSQNGSSLLAKILRIDVDSGSPYGIPKDNPFAGRAGFRPEIWAWGLRNPWRFAFDRQTGDLFIADVGQDQWEEVNVQPAGAPGGTNYGWNKMEGTHCYPPGATCDPAGFATPVAEYSHAGNGCSITGGMVYRGATQPALAGAYFFGDYCTGKLWALSRDTRGGWVTTPLITASIGISSFGEDEAGEAYIADINGGALLRIVAANK